MVNNLKLILYMREQSAILQYQAGINRNMIQRIGLVRGEKESDSGFCALSDYLSQYLLTAGIDSGKWFVQDDQTGIAQKGQNQCRLFEHTGRVGADGMLRVRIDPKDAFQMLNLAGWRFFCGGNYLN